MPVSKLKTFNAGVKGQRWARAKVRHGAQKHAAQLRESLASGDIAAVQPTQLADNTPLTSRSYKVFRRHHFRDSFPSWCDDPRSAAVE